MKLYGVKLIWFLEIIIIINFVSWNSIFIYGNIYDNDDLTIFYERSGGGFANLPPLNMQVDSGTLSQNEKNELHHLINLINISNLPSNNKTITGADYFTYHLIIETEDGDKQKITATDLNITKELRQLFNFLENKYYKQ